MYFFLHTTVQAADYNGTRSLHINKSYDKIQMLYCSELGMHSEQLTYVNHIMNVLKSQPLKGSPIIHIQITLIQ